MSIKSEFGLTIPGNAVMMIPQSRISPSAVNTFFTTKLHAELRQDCVRSRCGGMTALCLGRPAACSTDVTERTDTEMVILEKQSLLQMEQQGQTRQTTGCREHR